MKSALIFIHEEREGAGLFGDILADKNFSIRIIFTEQEDVSRLNAADADIVLIMGGPMGVYEADRYPFLKQEIEFLKKRIAADLPTLGICLGSQLIAAALGEKVFKGKPGQEIGWNPLKILDKFHPIRHFAAERTNMFHWHGDTYNVPRGAVHLAASSLYASQAYSYGRNILALQCHPEITPALAEEWIESLSPDADGSIIVNSREELAAQTKQNLDRLNVQARLFFEEWLSSVGL